MPLYIDDEVYIRVIDDKYHYLSGGYLRPVYTIIYNLDPLHVVYQHIECTFYIIIKPVDCLCFGLFPGLSTIVQIDLIIMCI